MDLWTDAPAPQGNQLELGGILAFFFRIRSTLSLSRRLNMRQISASFRLLNINFTVHAAMPSCPGPLWLRHLSRLVDSWTRGLMDSWLLEKSTQHSTVYSVLRNGVCTEINT